MKKLKIDDYLINQLEYIINYMNSEQGEEIGQAKYWLEQVDRLRRENYLETFPELSFIHENQLES